MASKEQKELMERFHNHTGFEFMGKDEVRADDPEGFVERWEFNCKWVEDVVTETRGMIDEYSFIHTK